MRARVTAVGEKAYADKKQERIAKGSSYRVAECEAIEARREAMQAEVEKIKAEEVSGGS